MGPIFVNSKSSRTSVPYKLSLNLTDKINLKRGDKYVVLLNVSIYYTWKNIKKLYKIIHLKYQLRHYLIELPDRSNSVSDIQDYFENILKNMWEKTNNPSIRIKDIGKKKKKEKRVTFRLEMGHYLQILALETMTLFGSTKSKITKDRNGEKVAHLEIIGIVLVHCNIVNIDHQKDAGVLYTFAPNKSFGRLLDI